MRNQPATLLALILFTAAWIGCKSSSPSPYVSPRVVGRVIDSSTQLPIVGVQVRRQAADETDRQDQPAKGGEMIARVPAVQTAEDGSFVLSSERDVALFRQVGWFTVNIAFSHPRYQALTIRYTLSQATNTTSGEPVIPAGDIRLVPLPK